MSPEGLARWVFAVCERWAGPRGWSHCYIDDYWEAIDWAREVEVPECTIAIPVSAGEFEGELVFDTSERGAVWLSDRHGEGIELGAMPRPPRPRADPEQVARFMAEFDLRPLEELPELRPEHPRLASGRVLGSCVLCGRGVAAFSMKWAGWAVDDSVLLVHAECYEATGLAGKAGPRPAPKVDAERRMAIARASRYREDLAGLRTPTLGSIVFAFDDAPKAAQLEHAWRLRVVRDELARRMACKLAGGVVEVDERLAEAAAQLDERERVQ